MIFIKIIAWIWDKYKKFALSLGKVYAKIPYFIWAGFAVLGILIVGMVMGAELERNSEPAYMSPAQKLSAQNEKYLDLIDSYEDLSTLYRYQGENVRIMMDEDIMNENPREFYDAVSSMKDYRDRILIQMGRIYELRKSAGLINEPHAQ